jgi:CubicO group peptidase (beta-lactamase class C family)
LRKLALGLLVVAARGVGAQTASVIPPDLDAYVASALRAFNTPGAAVAVVVDGRVVLAKGYGVKRLGDPAPVDAHTLFQIASNTKAFTSASLAMLVDEGRLRWDDHVADHLIGFQLYDPYVTREFTVRDMLTHRSGLGLGAGDLLWFHSNYSRRDVIYRIRYAKPTSSFRSQYAYDNVMYIAAGEVIPAVTDTSWETFIRQRIFEPLGMREAYTGIAGVPAGANMATPHGVLNGTLQIVPLDTVDVTGPAGGIIANVTDLTKWMMVQLDSGRVGDRRLWSADRTRQMWAAQTILPIRALPGALAPLTPQFAAYGLGWDLRDYRGHKIVLHDGGLAGMTSRTLLVPDRKLGIIVLTNGESDLSAALAFRVLDRALGAPATDWAAAFAARARDEEAKAAEVERGAAAARAKDSHPSLPLAGYAGRYTDAMYGDVTITQEPTGLVLRFSHSPAFVGDLEHWQYDTFVAHWRTANIPDAYVTFALTPAGAIETMKLAAVSPLADFSFDYQDLTFVPAAEGRCLQPPCAP